MTDTPLLFGLNPIQVSLKMNPPSSFIKHRIFPKRTEFCRLSVRYEANRHPTDVGHTSPQSPSAMSVYTGKFNYARYASNENIFIALLDGWVERGRVHIFTTFTKNAAGVEKCPFAVTQYVLRASDAADVKKFTIRDIDNSTIGSTAPAAQTSSLSTCATPITTALLGTLN